MWHYFGFSLYSFVVFFFEEASNFDVVYLIGAICYSNRCAYFIQTTFVRHFHLCEMSMLAIRVIQPIRFLLTRANERASWASAHIPVLSLFHILFFSPVVSSPHDFHEMLSLLRSYYVVFFSSSNHCVLCDIYELEFCRRCEQANERTYVWIWNSDLGYYGNGHFKFRTKQLMSAHLYIATVVIFLI